MAQKGIPDWLQELYDPLEERMQKKGGAVDSTVLRESQNYGPGSINPSQLLSQNVSSSTRASGSSTLSLKDILV